MRVRELLTELVGVKRFAGMTAGEVLKYIEGLGGTDIKVLGEGELGVAIQIGGRVYKMWQVDSAYEAFVEYALEHRDNPFMPRFKGRVKRMPAFFVRPEDAPDHVSYIEVERLEEVGDDVVWDNGDGPKISLEGFLNAVGEADGSVRRALKAVGATDGADPEFKRFAETVRDIYARHPKFSPDLSVFNVMMRGDQVVIIDPLASMADLALNTNFYYFAKKLRKGEDVPQKAAAGAKHLAGIRDIAGKQYDSLAAELKSGSPSDVKYALLDLIVHVDDNVPEGRISARVKADFKRLYGEVVDAVPGIVGELKKIRDGEFEEGTDDEYVQMRLEGFLRTFGLRIA